MFGKNEVTSPFRKDDGSLLVNSVFYTLQGEGPDAGRPAVFVRLAKCNLRCWFCDTEFEKGVGYTLSELVNAVLMHGAGRCNLVVITGGEPLLQNIIPFVWEINRHNFSVSIETAGTVWLDGLSSHFVANRSHNGNLIVCSPKTPKIDERLIPIIGAYKYIVKREATADIDGLPTESTQIKGEFNPVFRPPPGALVYVQPMDEGVYQNPGNLNTARDVALEHGYRLSVQVHKLCDLP